MPDPIPADPVYGRASWTDYVDNWRKKDAEWIEDRSILRFADTTSRDSALPTPGTGQMVFLAAGGGTLQMRGTSAWQDFKAMPAFLAKTQDDATQVLVSHSAAGGRGIAFVGTSPFEVQVNTDFRVQGGVLLVQGGVTGGVSIKTGTRTAKLTTDAANLISDTPLSAPSLTLSGSGTALSIPSGALTVGTLTAGSGSFNSVSLSGTLNGGVLNGSSGIIGGVSISGGTLTAAQNQGLISGQGQFYGDGSSAVMRQRAGTTQGAAYVQVMANDVVFNGPGISSVLNQLRIGVGRSIQWYNAGGGNLGNSGPVIYSATDPGAPNYPDGTIWFS